MAKAPGYLDKIQAILKLVENPCDEPWTVYLELAIEPLFNVVVALLTFGMDDVIRGYFRPKNLRSGRHLRRGKRGKRFKGGIPELGEEIGKKLPGAEWQRNRIVTHGVKVMWLIDGVLQRALFWWMVADLSIDFFYDWASAIFETEQCEKSLYRRLLAQGNTGGTHALFGWVGVLLPETVYSEGLIWNVDFIDLPKGEWDVTLEATVKAAITIEDTMKFDVALAKDGTFTEFYTFSSTTIANDTIGSAIVNAHISGPARVVAGMRCNVGLAVGQVGDFFVMETGSIEETPPA